MRLLCSASETGAVTRESINSNERTHSEREVLGFWHQPKGLLCYPGYLKCFSRSCIL